MNSQSVHGSGFTVVSTGRGKGRNRVLDQNLVVGIMRSLGLEPTPTFGIWLAALSWGASTPMKMSNQADLEMHFDT